MKGGEDEEAYRSRFNVHYANGTKVTNKGGKSK